MDVATIMDISSQALWIIIKCSAPLLLISLVVGLVISVYQTVTSIQEQTLTFVPKILAVFITLMICGGWIMNNLVEFTTALFKNFSEYVN